MDKHQNWNLERNNLIDHISRRYNFWTTIINQSQMFYFRARRKKRREIFSDQSNKIKSVRTPCEIGKRPCQVALHWSHVRSRQHATREPLTNDITLRTVTVLWAKPLSVSRGVGGHRMRMKHWWGRGRGETRRLGLMKISCHEARNDEAWIVSLFEQNPRTTLKIDFHWEHSCSLLLFYSRICSRIFFSKNRSRGAHNYCTYVRTYWIIKNFIYDQLLRRS